MRSPIVSLTLPMLLAMSIVSCGTGPRTETGRRTLEQDATATLAMFRQTEPVVGELVDDAAGYVVFPSIGKGGAGIGGAGGWGVVYENDEVVGYSRMSQFLVGGLLGGQSYSQLVILEHEDNLTRFKRGQLAVAAQGSAVAGSAGVAAAADYERGVIIFTATRSGLMFEGAIGAQQFTFQPRPD